MSRPPTATRSPSVPYTVTPEENDVAARAGDSEARVASILQPAHGNASERFGHRFGNRSPVLVFALTILGGYALLAALAIGLGYLVVDVLVPVHDIGRADTSVNEWLASHRSPARNDVSYVGSSIGDIPFIPVLVIATAVTAAIMRRWRIFAFVVGGILVEVATYRIASLVVHRDRPAVPRLDHLPVDQSYPSGHVAASVVVYVGLALLLSSRLRSGRWKTLLWTLAIALPLVVALSRMYRGMHHPLDVSAGVLIGLCSLAIALFASRAAVAAHDRSERGRA